MKQTQEKFEQWAIVEVFGHQRYAGLVTEATIGGCNFVQVNVPAVNGSPAFTKLFGQGAIYSITPVSEDIAKLAAENMRSAPVSIYMPELRPAIEAGGDDED